MKAQKQCWLRHRAGVVWSAWCMVLCCMVHSVPCSANALCIQRNLCYVGVTQQCIPTKNCTYIVARTV